jgi:hypothetical protein
VHQSASSFSFSSLACNIPARLQGSDTTLTQPLLPSMAQSLLPGPLFPRARRTQRFSSLPIGFSIPTVHSSLSYPSLLRGSGLLFSCSQPLGIPTPNTRRVEIPRLTISRSCSFASRESKQLHFDFRGPIRRYPSIAISPLVSLRLMRPISCPSTLETRRPEIYVTRVPPKVGASTETGTYYPCIRCACNSCTRQPRYADMR